MSELKTIYSDVLNFNAQNDNNEVHEQIVAFIQQSMKKNTIDFKTIDFMGIVYGSNHVSLRVPGVMELAIGGLYHSKKNRFIFSSPQRMHLVDEKVEGIDKLKNAFNAFKSGLGMICWYGETEFEMHWISA